MDQSSNLSHNNSSNSVNDSDTESEQELLYNPSINYEAFYERNEDNTQSINEFTSLQQQSDPIADMIIWENKKKFTCLRVIFAWVITLAICLGSYLLVAFATFQK